MAISFQVFNSFTIDQVAEIVKKNGPKVCCFPINGTRRWYLLESADRNDYLELTARRNIEIYRMLFAHGINTLLAPVFGSDLLERGPRYFELAAEGLSKLASSPDYLRFYMECGVRVNFYGGYRTILANTPYAYLVEQFDQIIHVTKENDKHRLFYGLFTEHALRSAAEFAIDYFSESGSIPPEDKIIEQYYGECIGPVDLFIGFDKFAAFDMPLLSTNNTDLYFTISPSLFFSLHQLRSILYDHIFTRRNKEPDYQTLNLKARERMRSFYSGNSRNIFGVGFLRDGIWYPTQADIPDMFGQ